MAARYSMCAAIPRRVRVFSYEDRCANVSMPLKKAHEVAFAKSAKRQNAPGAMSRKQLTPKHLPILVLNDSVESFSTPSFHFRTLGSRMRFARLMAICSCCCLSRRIT